MFWCDLEIFLSEHQIPYRKTSTGEVRINCPFCNDVKWHLYINEQKRVFHCFRCEQSGSIARLFRFLADGEPIPTVPRPQFLSQDEDDADIVLPEGFTTNFTMTQEGRLAWEYLLSRNLTPTQIERYGIGYAMWGKYRGRVIVPITHRGRVVSFVARAYVSGLTPKVLNPSAEEASPPSHYLFNLDQALFYPKVVLVEGVFDALTTGIVDGEYCAVATFGKQLTNRQLAQLCEAGFKEVVFAWDTRDAVPQILTFARALLPFFRSVRVAFLPGEEDPNSLGHERMAECVRQALPYEVAKLKLLYLGRLVNGFKYSNFNGNGKSQKFSKNFL